jgi:CubicO group peptidase (beta-lactamase class C family)
MHDAWRTNDGRASVMRTLAELPLTYAPGTRSIYSDPGFILLGAVLERAGGRPLDEQYAALPWTRELAGSRFNPGAELRPGIAPTAWCEWRQRLAHGEVHDSNAAALGGVAAHAGLFATAGAVAAYARLVLRTVLEPTSLGTPDLMRRFAARTAVPGSSRALAWDTALPTSSCGTRMSARAIGHTGFTGTSLWIDPEQDFYAVLLTNRVYPDARNEALVALRPRLHDALLAKRDVD